MECAGLPALSTPRKEPRNAAVAARARPTAAGSRKREQAPAVHTLPRLKVPLSGRQRWDCPSAFRPRSPPVRLDCWRAIRYERRVSKLAGKVLVIIGGTTGIGFSAARACLEAGANVVVVGRNADRSEERRVGKEC